MRPFKIKGIISKGFGEGKYYVSAYSNIIARNLGWKPYPGTINIIVNEATWRTVRALANKKINGFKKNNRIFHDVYYVECVLKGVRGIIVFPIVSKHGKNVIEVILPKKININMGENVEVLVI
ncbi:MAG: DUF120 domain-containing protein [Euryarchaeota archaeon]|nr:DUF120 domain-containing protein [Euryarchaeota archaeon]